MKILIIGSKGFLGGHCYDFFSGNGHDTWGCDILDDIRNPEYIKIDAKTDFSDIFKANNFDVCINCSGAANVSASLKNPYFDYSLNTVNVFKILDSIKSFNPLCKFINISSAAVYGNPIELPIKETHPLNPISPYGMHKKASEEICREFYEFYGIKTCSIRVFSAFGERLRKQIFWDLYKKTSKSEKLELFGTGNESRDFIYIFDLIHQIELIVQFSDFKGESINSANGKQILIKDIVKEFTHQLNWKGEIYFTNQERGGDPVNWQADISKISSFGYTQSYSIEQGIKNYISWARENT